MLKKYFKNKIKACPSKPNVSGACTAKPWRSGGFTIIETMISIGIFLVIVTIGMESLLNTSFIHSKSESQRSVMDNISFIMEEMSKNIRTGSEYQCVDNLGSLALLGYCTNGEQGSGISFKPSNPDYGNNITYYFDSDRNLFKVVDEVSTQLNSDDIQFYTSSTNSSFTITGEDSTDQLQPFVTIRLIGKIVSPKGDTPFSLQTSVSQRLIDIPQP